MRCYTSRLCRGKKRSTLETINKYERSALSSNRRSQPSTSSQHCTSRYKTTKCFDFTARQQESCQSFDIWLWVVQENERWQSFVLEAVRRDRNWRLDRTWNDSWTENGKIWCSLNVVASKICHFFLSQTISVDIFSMGCVYYYVLSYGDHLFGDTIKRQANILANEFDMSKLMSLKSKQYEHILAVELITDMIKKESSKRPICDSVLKHPMFWRDDKILTFLQDVSDRVEKLDMFTDPLRILERNARFIIREDWSKHLDAGITDDLMKYRGYHCSSVRDLLRALRNKVRLKAELLVCFYWLIVFLETSLSRTFSGS